MSHTIDALIITSQARHFSETVPYPADIEQGLWELDHSIDAGDRQERDELYAGELFKNLGAIAHMLSQHELPEIVRANNPLRGIVMRQIDEALPERTESLFPPIPGHDMGLDGLRVTGGSLYTHDFLVSHPELIPEYISKTAMVQQIITRRRKATGELPADTTFSLRLAPELLDAAVDDLSAIGEKFRHLP
jgi:hypothetical protein